MDAIMSMIMFTIGIGIHVVMWALMVEHMRNDPDHKIYWGSTLIGFIVLCIGSFLILTSIVKIATGALS